MIGIQHSGNDVSVRDGDVLSAAIVTHRARVCACAIWADLQSADGIDARDGAPAGADRVDIQHGQGNGTHVDFALSRYHRVALMDKRHVTTRAAHVEGNDVVDADALASAHGGDNAAGRSGKDRSDGFFGGTFECGNAAVGLHDVEFRRSDAELSHARFEPVQVARHHGLNIGVDDRGAETIELADLRQNFVRQREPRFGKFLGKEFFDLELVIGIQERKEKTDGHRIDAFFPEPRDRLP